MRKLAIVMSLVAAPAVAQVAPHGTIILYRGATVLGTAIACPIRHEGREVVELGRGKYAEWRVKPGRYLLNNKTASIDVSVDPGETRYVRCIITPGFFLSRATLQMSDKATFDQDSAKFERKEVNPAP